MSEMGDMVAHGAVAFTDDGRGVQGAGMLRRCMDYGKMFGKVFMSHCQDEDLVGHGQINEGKVSTRLALEGWPAAGEELQIARDIEIAKPDRCQAAHPAHLHRPWSGDRACRVRPLAFRLPARPPRTTCS